MAFADTAVRTIREGIGPAKLTLAAACVEGALLGYNAGWVLADANAGVTAQYIAGEPGVIGDVITVYRIAVIEGPTGMTAGGALYLSDTAGGYAETASTTSEQKVGVSLSATLAMVDLTPTGKFPVSINFAAAGVASIFHTASFRCRVTKITEVHATVAGQAGNLTVERLQGTEAPASGDDLTTAGFDLTATINTVVAGTLTATVAHRILEVGDRLALKVASGSAASLANANVTVELEPA